MLRKLTVIAIALLALVALASAPASAQYGTDSGVEGVGVDTGSGSGSGADDGTLARTGWDVNVPIVVGASLIVAGGLVLTVRRRRTPTLA